MIYDETLLFFSPYYAYLFSFPAVASVSAQPIAAGPMVTNNVVLRTLVAGNPAKFKKESYKFQFIFINKPSFGKTFHHCLPSFRGQMAVKIKLQSQPSVLSETINGKRSISLSVATALAKALGIPADIWMNMQTQYDLDAANIAERDNQRETVTITIPARDHNLLQELVRKFGWACVF